MSADADGGEKVLVLAVLGGVTVIKLILQIDGAEVVKKYLRKFLGLLRNPPTEERTLRLACLVARSPRGPRRLR